MSGAPPVPPGLTPAKLTARLAVEFCIPMIAGGVRGAAPVEGHMLDQQARSELGADLADGGATIMYPVGADSVLLDMAGSRSTIWFGGADAVQADAIVDSALRAAHPSIRQLSDDPNPNAPNTRTRGYTLELSDSRVAMFEMGYPLANADPRDMMFVLRVTAMVRQPGAAPAPAAH